MSDFRALCQDVAAECGVAGTDRADLPTTVIGQFGELGRIVRWVRQAWLEVQGSRKFSWMLETVTMPVLAGTNVVAATVPFNRYTPNAYYLPTGSNANTWIDQVEWDWFRQTYDTPWLTQSQHFSTWTIRPSDNAFLVNGRPLVNTDVFAERYANPTTLMLDNDTPEMPEDLHRIIVLKAKIMYSDFDEAGAMRQTATAQLAPLMVQLYDRCLPEMTLGGNLLDS